MKKLLLTVALMVGLSTIASADIYNGSCNVDKNRISFSHNGLYNHAWVYVNSIYVGDFWTISSGLGTYSTNLESDDYVGIYFYTGDDYGYHSISCD